jgi:hypothetical protein
MPIFLLVLFLVVTIVGVVFEGRARRSGEGWRSVLRDFLATIGALALIVLVILAIAFVIAARGGSY